MQKKDCSKTNEHRANTEKMQNKAKTDQEERQNEQLVARIRAGEDEAGNMLQLWQQNQGFIRKLAMKYSAYAELDDLKQEGYIGLCEAVRHYDQERGMQFISYAAFWIRNGMRRYVANCNMIRIPEHARSEIGEYKKILSEFRKYYGKEPTDREMRALLLVDAEKLEDIKKNARMGKIRSLSEPIGEEDDYTLGDSVASGENMEEDAIRRLDRERMSRQIWIEVDRLPENQAAVIRWRFLHGKTMRETGEEMGSSLEEARKLHDKALRTLRLPKKIGRFRSYHEAYLTAASIRHVGIQSFNRTWTSEVEREALEEW